MNILLDYISLQQVGGIGGAGSFTRKVTDEIYNRYNGTHCFYALIDSSREKSERYDLVDYAEKNATVLIDVKDKRIRDIVSEYHIDTMFISIGQWYSKYDLEGISCKVVMFIHDIYDVEREDIDIDKILYDRNVENFVDYLRRFVNVISGRWHRQMKQCYNKIMKLYSAPNVKPYTVSNYSKHALMYYFPELKNEISVCYSPLKNVVCAENVENLQLRNLIDSGKPYLLHIAANRRYKNPHNTVKVFKRLAKENPDLQLLTLRYGKSVHPRHLDVRFLSDSDLEYAYKHASALIFTSFFEGFGYPPIEAMKYGTPVVASNVTSVPEIVADAAVLVSPFYPADIYTAVRKVLEEPETYSKRGIMRYKEIRSRQEIDMEKLLQEFD